MFKTRVKMMVLLVVMPAVVGCGVIETTPSTPAPEQVPAAPSAVEGSGIFAEEQVFNASGRAKAILDESDLFPPEDNATRAALAGRWVSVDDPKSEIGFVGDQKFDYYDGEKVSAGAAIVSGDRLTVEVDGDLMEYVILKLTDTELELSYLPRGNTLRYARYQE